MAEAKKWFAQVKELYQPHAPKILIGGPTGVGKSHFILTCPKPIYAFDPEQSLAPVAYHNFPELRENDQLFIAEIGHIDPKTKEIDPAVTLDNFNEAILEILPDVPEGATLALDSGTLIWQTLGWWLDDLKEKKMVKMTRGGHMLRTEWGKANKRFYQWIQQLISKKKLTVVITSQMTDVYDNSGNVVEVDGKMRIQKQTKYWVDYVYRMYEDARFSSRKVGDVTKTDTFKERKAFLVKCRFADVTQFTIEERTVSDLTYPKMIEHLESLGLMFGAQGEIKSRTYGQLQEGKEKTVKKKKMTKYDWQ